MAMNTSKHLAFRLLALSTVVVLATCNDARDPLGPGSSVEPETEPTTKVVSRQQTGEGIRVARVIEPLEFRVDDPARESDPDTLESINVQRFGVDDSQGLTVDPASGTLFVLDSDGRRIVRVEPDPLQGLEEGAVAEIDLRKAGLSGLRGLALQPATGHLYTLDPSTELLHVLDQSGQIVATHDVADFGLQDTQKIWFGPSGDSTDDPSELSLYATGSGTAGSAAAASETSLAEAGWIVELSFDRPEGADAEISATFPGTLVQTIDTWQFSPPSPDPAGITYVDHLQHLLIADSEVNEMPIYAGANVFAVDLPGTVLDTYTTVAYSTEPTGITSNPANRHLFISDDIARAVFEIDPGPDSLHFTADDVVTSFSTTAYGSSDPEGITYDIAQGVLFVVDGVNSEVYRVSPGANGWFDGIAPTGDDQVSSFDTEAAGLTDPEGIAFDSDFGHLYAVGEPEDRVFHFTTDGTLLRTIDISASGARTPAGMAYAPGSVDQGQMGLWIVDRWLDNGSNPDENDGQAYEFSVPPLPGNFLPTVVISSPESGLTFLEGDSISFLGTATDFEDGDLTTSLTWTSNLDGSIGTGGSFGTNALSVGAHSITASVTDGGGAEGTSVIAANVISYNPGEDPGTLDVRVTAGTDDAEERGSGSMRLTSSDLEMVFDGDDQAVGLRFTNVTIPQGATINNAYVQFTVDEENSDATSLTVSGHAADNAPTFSSVGGNIRTRPATTSSVPWSPVPWTVRGRAGPDERTPDISNVIQEIVNRPGWSLGNSIAIVVTGSGERTAEAYEGSAASAPLLHVDYGVPSDGIPTASFSWNVNELIVDFTDTSTDSNGTVVGWSWDFGDGNGSTEQNPQHTYASPGDYTVTLSVTDDEGASSTTPASHTVSPGSTFLSVPGDFSTIQAAHDAATSGDTIMVEPGTHAGQVIITKAITLASRFLTTGDTSYIASTIIDGAGGEFVIELPAGAEDGTVIKGLTIQNANDGITPFARFDLLNSRVWNTGDGVDYDAGSGGLLQYNTLEQNSDDGIDLDRDVDVVIADNIIRDNGGDGIETRLQGYAGPTLNITITRNRISGNDGDGIQLIDYGDLTDRRFEISYNYIYDNAGAGLGMMDSSTSTEDFRATSILETIFVFNNTFAFNNHGLSGGDSTIVLNNIFVGHPVIAVKNVDGGSELAFNLFFNNGTDNSGSNVDVASSIFDDPLLTSSFELPSVSTAIDAGTALYMWQGMTVLDLPFSSYFGAAPDMGAFESESGSPPNVAPTANYTWSATDLTVDFTDTSTDGDGTVVGWAWDFGDGNTSTAQNPQHTYASAGGYTVTLSVTDDDGASSVAPASQTVSPAAPLTVTEISPSSVVAGATTSMTLNGTGFVPGATVSFENGTAGPRPDAADVVVVEAGVITVTVTTRSGGPKRDRVWDVRVTNPDGTSADLAAGLVITP